MKHGELTALPLGTEIYRVSGGIIDRLVKVESQHKLPGGSFRYVKNGEVKMDYYASYPSASRCCRTIDEAKVLASAQLDEQQAALNQRRVKLSQL